MSVLHVPEITWRDDAVKLLSEYFGSPDSGATPYSGASFDTFAGGGNRSETYDRFTTDDVVAVSMLGVQVPAAASLELFGEQADEYSELLRAIPPTAELVNADDSLIDESSAAWKLWQKLHALDGVGPTIAAKLLARKRPALLPVYDEVIRRTLQRPNPDLTFWTDLREALRVEDRALYTRLQGVRDQVESARRLSIIRVFDIVVWMHGRALAQTDTGKESH